MKTRQCAARAAPPSTTLLERTQAAGDLPEAATSDRASLLALLGSTIIPALLNQLPLAEGGQAQGAVPPAPRPSAEIAAFASLCLMEDASLATAFARQLVLDGLCIEEIFDGLMAPAARHLGHLWDRDIYDFTQVTLGLSRMQHMALHFSQSTEPAVTPAELGLHALFAPIPRSQHTLGVMMVSELFRQEGWQVTLKTGASQMQLLAAVRAGSYEAIGLSIGLDDDIHGLKHLIQALRASSKNPRVKILVGGPLLGRVEGLALQVGADAGAADARVARKLARALALPVARGASMLTPLNKARTHPADRLRQALRLFLWPEGHTCAVAAARQGK